MVAINSPELTRKKLLSVYDLFADWAGDFSFACRKGCSTCCTRSVSMTTLEGELVIKYMEAKAPGLLKVLTALPDSSLNPKTTNQFAADCLDRKENADDQGSWDMEPCVFLEDDCCAIYPVRPFMCRSLGSRIPCHRTGSAEMDPLFLTLNTIILQCIEHLDRGRPWGNMNTILKMVKNGETGGNNANGMNCRISRSIPGFLVPPEEAEELQDRMETLLKLIHEL